jgi:hypothetical protein
VGVVGESYAGPLRAEDIDGDDDLDVLTGGPIEVLVWRNDGAAGFAQPFTVDIPADLGDFAVVDGDGDGALDLLATSRADSSGSLDTVVPVALGDGAGGFADAVASPTGSGFRRPPLPLGGADIDGDAHLDVFRGTGNPDVYVLHGHGDGSFGPPIVSPSGAGSVATVATADVDGDGDGHLDVASDPTVVFGDGAGHFVEPHDIVGGVRLATADLDGNGQPDLVAAGLAGHRLNVLLNHLDGRGTTTDGRSPTWGFARWGAGPRRCGWQLRRAKGGWAHAVERLGEGFGRLGRARDGAGPGPAGVRLGRR